MQFYKPFTKKATATLLMLGVLALPQIAHADAFMDQVTSELKQFTGPQTAWHGPTTGPAIAPGKFIVYMAGDEQNDSYVRWGEGIKEAAAKAGWKIVTVDGHGTPNGWQEAANQALAMKPDGIILGAEASQLKSQMDEAARRKIPVVGIHAAPLPGPQTNVGLFANIQQSPIEIGRAQADWVIAHSDGKARVIVTTDCQFSLACIKANSTKKRLEECKDCKVLEFSSSPFSETSQRQPELVTAWVQKYGFPLYITDVADYTADYQIPALRTGGVDPSQVIIVSADGNPAAYQRIRAGNQYQVVTAPVPYQMEGYQAIDELNRAFHGQPASGFVPSPYLVTAENIHAEGGDDNAFTPGNNYAAHYQQIWVVK